MARTLDDPAQYLHGYSLFKQGISSAAAIARSLEDAFGDRAKPSRTVRTWITKYERAAEATANLDDPVEWHRLEEYGLPWEASHEVLRAWAQAQHYGHGQFPLPRPTARQARWWWRVMKAAPSMSVEDALSVAGAFVERELRRDVLGESVDLRDLEACLAFAPWDGWPDDKVNAQRYEAAIATGIIPKLRPDSYQRTADLVRRMDTARPTAEQVSDEASGGQWMPLRPSMWPMQVFTPGWLLPSQRPRVVKVVVVEEGAV